MDIAKRVADPVHGSIPMSPLEVEVMDTQVFQRLRRVKQLGLAHYVFPSADYSRLSHSLGVCHVAGQTINSLDNSLKKSERTSEKDKQLYRLAGLLHDIGHYPLSHCTEHALRSYYSDKKADKQLLLKRSASTTTDVPSEAPEAYNHEGVSQLIVTRNPELKSIFKKYRVNPDSVASIFLRQGIFRFDKLVNSDLDSDRIDYLLRSSRATGLPYGSVDINYLLSQLCVDDDGQVCIHPKGLRAAEHMLLCRYFDYQQVVFHKSVVGFEQLVEQVTKILLDKREIDFTKPTVETAVENNEWLKWDDEYLMGQIHSLANDSTADEITRLKAQNLVSRTSPKLVVDLETIDTAGKKPLTSDKLVVVEAFKKKAGDLGVLPEQWFEWERMIKLTSIGTAVPTAELPDFEEEQTKSIRVLKSMQGKKGSERISERRSSVMSVLGDKRLYMFRLYVVAKDREQRAGLSNLSRELMEEYHELQWK